MNMLIVGGSSGLGFALAKKYAELSDKVIVTGRTEPSDGSMDFKYLDLSGGDLPELIKDFVADLPTVGRLVYAAGFYRQGTITDLSDEEIEAILDVSGRGQIYFLKYLLEKQDRLDELITITSTTQWRARRQEPVYGFTKAGAGQFSNSMAADGRVGKVLVAAPSSMHPDFGSGAKTGGRQKLLDKQWVAGQIIKQNQPDFSYKFIKILSQPARIEVAEER